MKVNFMFCVFYHKEKIKERKKICPEEKKLSL